jgi:hypothetical protein
MSIVARHMMTLRNRVSSDIVLVSWIASLLLTLYALYIYRIRTTGGCDGGDPVMGWTMIIKRGLLS